jgi:hypothetical protein
MELSKIREKIRADEYIFSQHAETERKNDSLEISDVESAILNGEILENYPDTGRGESCLILGYSRKKPVHAVCGWNRHQWVVVITVYIPQSPKWTDDRTRRRR